MKPPLEKTSDCPPLPPQATPPPPVSPTSLLLSKTLTSAAPSRGWSTSPRPWKLMRNLITWGLGRPKRLHLVSGLVCTQRIYRGLMSASSACRRRRSGNSLPWFWTTSSSACSWPCASSGRWPSLLGGSSSSTWCRAELQQGGSGTLDQGGSATGVGNPVVFECHVISTGHTWSFFFFATNIFPFVFILCWPSCRPPRGSCERQHLNSIHYLFSGSLTNVWELFHF